jgi:hypothetical protein
MKAMWGSVSVAAMVLGFGMTTLVQAQQAKPAMAAPALEKSAPVEAEWSNPLPSGRLNLGIHFGDQQTESFGDILVPVIQFESGLMFVNPRGTWNDSDGQEFNIGLGYRHLFPDRNIIIGGNLFYDLRNTSLDNTFNQFGCGLEFLSTWVDARVNAYLPETGKKTADHYATATSKTQEQGSYWYAPTGQGHLITQYGYDVTSTYDVKTLQHYQISEQAMDGFDCEIGALLPIPVVTDFADVKVFAGYYDYNAHYGDDITGMKGRLEIKPMPSLYLDAAWFEDRELLGSKYSVGVRLSVPFDLASLSRGKNPFAGALDGFKPGPVKPPFASRMTEMVVRDLHIRSDMSDPEEVISDRRILEKKMTSLDRKDFNLVLASGVTFVDDDNRSGVEDGSWENPYRQINTGVQSAIGTMVYVRDATQQYYENVVLRDGLTLWGSGALIYGQGARYLGGIYPIVNGMGTGPAITLANNVTVAGFQITQPDSPRPAFKEPAANVTGIYGKNVTGVSVRHNIISGSMESGVMLRSDAIPSLLAEISDNRIEGMWGNGIDVQSLDTTGVDLTLANNSVTGSGGSGASLISQGGDTFRARVSGVYSGNLLDGISVEADNTKKAVAVFVDTRVNGNGRDGIRASVSATSPQLGETGEAMLGGINIMADDNKLSGLNLKVRSDSRTASYLVLAGIEANRNVGGLGIDVGLSGGGIGRAALTDIRANRNGNDGVFIQTDCTSLSDGNSHVWISENAVQEMRLHGGGIDFLGMDIIPRLSSGGVEVNGNGDSGIHVAARSQGNSFVDIGDVAASGNIHYGILVESDSIDGQGAVNLHDNTTSGNGVNGLRVVLSSTTDGAIAILNNVANGNGSDGISIDTTVGLNLTLTGRSNVAKNNSGDGIDLAIESDSGTYDFGTETVYGNNSMTGNGDVGIRWDNTGDGEDLWAQNNYWGGLPDVIGNVVADPHLTDEPGVP